MRTTCARTGCHGVLTRKQALHGKGYCCRPCAALACWQERPDVRQKRLSGMRVARRLRRIDLWAQPAWEKFTRLVDIDGVDRRVLAAVQIVLADAVTAAHKTGYRSGYQAEQLRRRRERDARRLARAA